MKLFWILVGGVAVGTAAYLVQQSLTRIEDALGMVLERLEGIKRKEATMAMTSQEVLDKVRAQKTVLDALKVDGDNTIAFQQTLKDKIQQLIDAGNNDPALQAIADELDANTSEAQATQTQLHDAIITAPDGSPAPLS